ncbi:MAG TPA: hypothetical protein VMZ91_05355 [Candidatus Paceibacterota bacterium]|nr:hypothetical protein [Candidatus Paceibacterota bacterium]
MNRIFPKFKLLESFKYPLEMFLYFVGVTAHVVSIFQWQIWNNDFSQFLFGVGISFILIILGYLYRLIREIQEEEQALGLTTTEIINKVEVNKSV